LGVSSKVVSTPSRCRGALAGDPPQDRVDQAGIARGAAVGLGQAHRQVDGGVVGHFEPENLRHPDQQRGLGPRGIGRQAALEENAEQMPQRPKPAQHGGDEVAHQRAVAVRERREPRLRVQKLVERPMAA
jgi:hypothetical protein